MNTLLRREFLTISEMMLNIVLILSIMYLCKTAFSAIKIIKWTSQSVLKNVKGYFLLASIKYSAKI